MANDRQMKLKNRKLSDDLQKAKRSATTAIAMLNEALRMLPPPVKNALAERWRRGANGDQVIEREVHRLASLEEARAMLVDAHGALAMGRDVVAYMTEQRKVIEGFRPSLPDAIWLALGAVDAAFIALPTSGEVFADTQRRMEDWIGARKAGEGRPGMPVGSDPGAGTGEGKVEERIDGVEAKAQAHADGTCGEGCEVGTHGPELSPTCDKPTPDAEGTTFPCALAPKHDGACDPHSF